MCKIETFLAVITLFASMSASALQVCSFGIPDTEGLRVREEKGCALSILGKKNYLGLDYLVFYDHDSISKTLSDDTFFVQEDNNYYFISEEAEDAKATLKVNKQEAARHIAFNGLDGYAAQAEYFVEKFPPWNSPKGSGYSLNVSCLFMAAGNGKKSFRTRFCTPQTEAGGRQMRLYKSMLEHIQP